MKKTFLIVLVSVMVMAQLMQGIYAQAANAPFIRIDQVKYEPFPAQSGSYFKLFLKVENTGTRDASNVEVQLDPKFPFSLDPSESERKTIGKLPAKDYALFEYNVRVDSNAVDGDNDLLIKYSENGIEDNTFLTQVLNINVKSSNPDFAAGLIRSVPAELKADTEDVKLTVELQNIGEGDAKLVTAELELPEGFSPSTSFSNIYNLGTIQKDSSKEAVFYIDTEKDIMAGTYMATLLVRYKNENNNRNDYVQKQILIDLNVKPSPNFIVEEVRAGAQTSSDSFTGYVVRGDVTVTPSSISQGSAGELRIRLKNTGEEEAKSVSVKVFKDSTHPFDFNEIYDFIGNLKPGESGDAVFAFNVDQDATLKKYIVEIEIRYVDGNDVNTQRATVPLDVSVASSTNPLIYISIIAVVVVAGAVLWRKKGKKE